MTNIVLAIIGMVLTFGGTMVGIYTSLQTKIKELDMKILALEKDFEMTQKQGDRIMEKLDEITNALMELKIQLHNKQDRL